MGSVDGRAVSPQGVAAEEQPPGGYGRVHVPAPHRRPPRYRPAAGPAAEGGGLLHRPAAGAGEHNTVGGWHRVGVPRVPCGDMGVARGRVCLHHSETHEAGGRAVGEGWPYSPEMLPVTRRLGVFPVSFVDACTPTVAIPTPAHRVTHPLSGLPREDPRAVLSNEEPLATCGNLS